MERETTASTLGTDDLIEEIIQISLKNYKIGSKGCYEASCLDKHIPIKIDGIEFTYWREYVVYKVCQYLKEKLPECELECNLDGNNSSITLTISDNEQEKIDKIMKTFIEENTK